MTDEPEMTATVIVLDGEPIAVCKTTAQAAAFFRLHPWQETIRYETFVVPCFLAAKEPSKV